MPNFIKTHIGVDVDVFQQFERGVGIDVVPGPSHGVIPHFLGENRGVIGHKTVASLTGIAQRDTFVPFILGHLFLEGVEGLGLELYVRKIDGYLAVVQVLAVVERSTETVGFARPVFGKVQVGIQLRVQNVVSVVKYPLVVPVALDVDIAPNFGVGVGRCLLVEVELDAKTFGTAKFPGCQILLYLRVKAQVQSG